MAQTAAHTVHTTSDLGTVEWALRRDGQMTRGETLRTIATAGRVLIPTIPAQILLRLGRTSSSALSYDIDEIPLPDSKIAREAEQECREASPQRIVDQLPADLHVGDAAGAPR